MHCDLRAVMLKHFCERFISVKKTNVDKVYYIKSRLIFNTVNEIGEMDCYVGYYGDILVSSKAVIVPHRRSTAEATQILSQHLLGDASSPFIVGAVSFNVISIPRSISLIYYI